MAYVALYRKYRSQSFGELMGQEQVTRTLQNALKTGRVAHAYLFHGARGCGKTSTARLLARALNCIAQDGPTPEPCGECRLCVSIRDGACMDVVEMDAASETGIDDVRDKIIENVQYAPGEARYKVYIIDEVHDLSAKAFDALLKTLEEPPPHVVFVLATTEIHKVPITIRSRCQLYPFKRGTLQDLAAAVQRVLEAEGHTAEPEAIQAIARSAEGSWRDALSLLEQVLAYSDGHVTAETVHQAIGTVGFETLARVTETLARGNWDETLAVAAELIDSGKDVRQLLTALSGHLRDLMLISAGAKRAAAQELGEERLALLTPQAALFDPPTLLAMMGILAEKEKEIRFTNQHRWLLERTLLALMPANQGAPVNNTDLAVERASAISAPVPQAAAPRPLAATPTFVPKPPVPEVSPVKETPFIAAEEDESDLAEEPVEIASAKPDLAPAPSLTVTPPPAAPVGEPLPSGKPAEAAPTPAPASAARFAEDVTLEVVQRAWPRILRLIKQKSPAGVIHLEKAQVVALQGKTIVLAFSDSFARDRIQNKPKGRELVEEKINEGLNSEGYRIRCELLGQNIAEAAAAPAATASASAPPATGMPTLLEAPPALTGPTRIADFEAPAALEPTPATYNGNGTHGDAPVEPPPSITTQQPQDQSPPPGKSLLTETLELFGGEVVRSERMANDA
ncbi:MAG TPA: DNA polymerase III subunit gamma/tau [Chthonomonadaceae bacterium]|nr:DNA polymerase III subunit gamma/tau [Chthonomonadaceae bacterium]